MALALAYVDGLGPQGLLGWSNHGRWRKKDNWMDYARDQDMETKSVEMRGWTRLYMRDWPRLDKRGRTRLDMRDGTRLDRRGLTRPGIKGWTRLDMRDRTKPDMICLTRLD